MNYTPDYARMHRWEVFSRELPVEYRQAMEEGRDIEPLHALIDAVNALPDGAEKEELGDVIFRMIDRAPLRAEYPYAEPSDLDGILAARDGKSSPLTAAAGDVLRNKIRGAWYGRICGCLLGKPLEGIRTPELYAFLRETGNFPLHRYVLHSDLNDERCARYKFPFAERTSYPDIRPFPEADDDTNYTVLAQLLIRRFGRGFTPQNMADFWLDMQPKNAYCTAERVAFRNFTMGICPPASATYKNPYREWIGAQIRGDYFGYINPGDPAAAAEMAWRDASISHVKNGIYGEMYIAAMLAAAAATDDIATVVRAGLSQIPAKSRLYERASAILEKYESGVPVEEVLTDIASRWNEFEAHDWCHTISNAEIVTAALLYFGENYGQAICRTVQCGFDTDCNGATVGSILGMLHGYEALGEEWTSVVHGKLGTSLFGLTTVDVEEAVDTTLAQIAQK